MSQVTQLITQMQEGNQAASELLLPLLYEELRKLAAAKMASEREDHTLTPTALVHEAYLRLVGSDADQQWNGRGHFFGAAADAMRRILIDNARRRGAQRRGGARRRFAIEEAGAIVSESDELLELDEALQLLECHDSQAAQVVKLRYFAGLTMAQAAEALGLSLRSA